MDCVLTINVGSSSLKFAIFKANKLPSRIYKGHVDCHRKTFSIYDEQGKLIQYEIDEKEIHNLLQPKTLFQWIQQHYPKINIKAIGHRVVHGGKDFLSPVLVSKSVVRKLKKFIPLAPLHMPSEVSFVEKTLHDFPRVANVACFDTAFHRNLPRLATFFAIPRKYINKHNIIRYGFHGLSYEYIVSILPKYIKSPKSSKVIIAHLGNGASMCAIRKGKNISTTMGFSALDGLMMGTRCGDIDPGIIIYWMEEHKLSIEEVKNILYKKSGLFGISGITGDVKKLIESKNPNAKEAIDLFCYNAISKIGSLVSMLHGLDALIFTGGIGTYAPVIRSKICKDLEWLGLQFDPKQNKNNADIISTSKSKIKVCVIPTNEELIIAKHVMKVLKEV